MSVQSVPLHHLPNRSLSAAANMAVDSLLLEAYPQPQAPRFRHYGWSAPAFTFGRTQAWQSARTALPIHTTWQDAHQRFATAFELVRRPTGGGAVDHRSDWTYALVIPASHPLAHAPARSVYRQGHQVLLEALAAQGVSATLAPCPQQSACASGQGKAQAGGASNAANTTAAATPPATAAASVPASATTAPSASAAANALASAPAASEGAPKAASVCFVQAEPYDIVSEDGEKLAGAAQRRTRDGLLVQGSVSRPLAGGIDWQRFETEVAEGFARWLAQADGLPQTPPEPSSVLVRQTGFPAWGAQLLQERIEHYGSAEWNRRR